MAGTELMQAHNDEAAAKKKLAELEKKLADLEEERRKEAEEAKKLADQMASKEASEAQNEKVIADLGEHVMRAWLKMHPIGRIGEPREIAEAAIYLASDAAGFTTGTDLRVDGGLTAAPRFVPDLV